MSKFNRDDFEYSGGYLMFTGDAGSQNEYYDHSERVHPTRRGTRKALFVARFKYSGRDKARFLTFLINNFSPEQYFAARNAKYGAWNNPHSPATILEAKGYVSATVRKTMKANGYTSFTTATYRDHFVNFVSTSDGGCSEYFDSVDAEHAAILKVAA